MKVKNLTQHDVTLFDGDVVVARWAPEGAVARVRETITDGPLLDTETGQSPPA